MLFGKRQSTVHPRQATWLKHSDRQIHKIWGFSSFEHPVFGQWEETGALEEPQSDNRGTEHSKFGSKHSCCEEILLTSDPESLILRIVNNISTI